MRKVWQYDSAPKDVSSFSEHTKCRTLEVTEVKDTLCGAGDGGWEVRAGQRGPPHAPFQCGSPESTPGSREP